MSLQTILKNCYLKNHCKQFLTIIREVIASCYQRSHSTQFLQTIVKELIWNNTTHYYQRNYSKQFLKTIISETKSFQTILKNYYQRSYCLQFSTIIREVIANNSYNYCQRIHSQQYYILANNTGILWTLNVIYKM